MEVENFFTSLQAKINQKANQNTTYRKAQGIYESVVQATKAIPNFYNVYGNTDSSLALYLFGSVYKLVLKVLEGDAKYSHNMDAYLLLINNSIPQINTQILLQKNMIGQIQQNMFRLLNSKQKSPLMTRLTVSILSYTFMAEIDRIDFEKDQDKKAVLLSLFESAVESHRNNILSKQTSKLLTHLARNNVSVTKIISEYAKANLLSNLQNRKQLYLNNVKQLVRQFPVRLINDIAYRIGNNLVEIDHSDINNEQYLTQTYFFLEKIVDKLLQSTLQQILKVLISNVPNSSESDKILYCYLQLIYEITNGLSITNQRGANKYLSSIIGIYQELLLINKKIQKFASNLFAFLISNCIKPSLWKSIQNSDALDILRIQSIDLEESQGHNFEKVICMIRGMLSSRFPNTRITANIIAQFFNKLDISAFDQSRQLVQKVIEFRSQLDDKSFKKIIHSIFNAFTIQSFLLIYPISLEGNIADSGFQEMNNLWVLSCVQKYEGDQNLETFMRHFLPLIFKSKSIQNDKTLSKSRKDGYLMIEEIVWRCFKVFSKNITKTINYEEILSQINSKLTELSQNTLEHVSIALENLCASLYTYKYQSLEAQQIIKKLAQIIDLSKNNSKQLLRAIKTLSLIANQEYINKVFDKNISKLIQSSEEKTIMNEEQKNIKNIEILIAVSYGVHLNNSQVTTTYRISREQLVVRLVSNLINEQNLFQKKGYKYIYQMIDLAPKSFIMEIIQIIEAKKKIMAASKHYRLGILLKIWKSLKSQDMQENIETLFNFIKSYLPEILIALRENNKRARHQANQIMADFINTMIELGLLQSFIESICAGFAADRSETKLATLAGLSIIIARQEINKNDQFFQDVLEIVLLLLRQKKAQLYKGVVDFCKKFVVTLEKSKQNQLLPIILKQLFLEDQQSKLEHRSILKHFLLKLVKKHDRDHIEKLIPAADRKILSHAIKTENRQKKKKRQQNKLRRQQMMRRKQQKESDDETSNQDSNNQVDENQMIAEQQGQELQDLNNTNNLLLKYDLEKENFHFEQNKYNHEIKQNKHHNRDQEGDISFNQQGLMIVREDLKRPRNKQEDEKDNAQQKDARVFENFKKKNKNDVIHQVKQSGETYKSGRAGGDVRLRDKPEPYAFIQFNSKALNKRFKKKAEKIFDAIFQKKQGGLKGVKSRLATKTH